MVKASVVGSGPNGLAAALTLAKAGVEVTVYEAAETVGGGARSAEVTVPGVLHDVCSMFHPLAVDNPFVSFAQLDQFGLEWLWPDVQYAHPLDSGDGAAAYRSVAHTAQDLEDTGWQRLFGSVSETFPTVTRDFLRPMLRIPDAPLRFANFGLRAGLPANVLAGLLRTDRAKALFAGAAAHGFRPLRSFGSAAIGVALASAGHAFGWPAAKGGSASIVDAMVAALDAHGATVVTGAHIDRVEQLPETDIVMFNTAPSAAADLMGDRLSDKLAKQLRTFRHGPSATTLSFAVEDGIPWTYEPARRAGTVHIGGSFSEIAFVERQITDGVMPRNPFVLVGQQSVADPSRARGNVHPVDAYAHVPYGYPHDASEVLLRQLERFAPGLRERIVATASRSPGELAAQNPNFINGDIATGTNTFTQLVFRPRPALNPYWLGVPGAYLCSAGTPPGAGAHGMAGYNAAMAALREAGL